MKESRTRSDVDFAVHPVVLYDGVCGLCNRLVRFILRRDPAGLFQFASLQSALAAGILARHGADAGDLDTVYVVVNRGRGGRGAVGPVRGCDLYPDAFGGSRAALGGTAEGGCPHRCNTRTHRGGCRFWSWLGSMLRFVPRKLREWGYGVVARNRYRIFGRYDSCPVPSEETRGRFLGLRCRA